MDNFYSERIVSFLPTRPPKNKITLLQMRKMFIKETI